MIDRILYQSRLFLKRLADPPGAFRKESFPFFKGVSVTGPCCCFL